MCRALSLPPFLPASGVTVGFLDSSSPEPLTSPALQPSRLPCEHEWWCPGFRPWPPVPTVSHGSPLCAQGPQAPLSDTPNISGAWDTSAAAWLAPTEEAAAQICALLSGALLHPACFSLRHAASSRL